MPTIVADRHAVDAIVAPVLSVPGPRRPEADEAFVLGNGLDPFEERSWSDEPRVRALPTPLPSLPKAPPAEVRSRKTWVDHLLTVGAVIGLLMTGVTIAASTSGLRPLVVKSGSMEPIIATGGMVLVKTVPAAQIRVGDVVAVERPDHTRVTHRVVTVAHRGGTAELVLKGDANKDTDPVPVTVTEAGKMVWTAPWLGRISAFLTSAKGGFVLGCLVTGVLLTVLRRKSD